MPAQLLPSVDEVEPTGPPGQPDRQPDSPDSPGQALPRSRRSSFEVPDVPADDMAELSALNDQRNRRRRRRLSSQQATSLSQELHVQPILRADLVGTYSCHGIDANKAKINQDGAAIAYPLAGDQHAALFVVVDGHGRLGHDVTAEVAA